MPRADRRTQLVDSAEAVFVEQGFAAASMDDVAKRAGVTKPVLYDHFGSKDGLLAAVISRLGDQLMQTTVAATGATSPEQSLRDGLTSYFRFVDRQEGTRRANAPHQIHLDDAVEGHRLIKPKDPAAADAGVHDQDIDPAKVALDLGCNPC